MESEAGIMDYGESLQTRETTPVVPNALACQLADNLKNKSAGPGPACLEQCSAKHGGYEAHLEQSTCQIARTHENGGPCLTTR